MNTVYKIHTQRKTIDIHRPQIMKNSQELWKSTLTAEKRYEFNNMCRDGNIDVSSSQSSSLPKSLHYLPECINYQPKKREFTYQIAPSRQAYTRGAQGQEMQTSIQQNHAGKTTEQQRVPRFSFPLPDPQPVANIEPTIKLHLPLSYTKL